MSLAGGDAAFGPRFVRLAFNSASLATITALLAVAIALFLAYGARITRSRVAAAREPPRRPGLRDARAR